MCIFAPSIHIFDSFREMGENVKLVGPRSLCLQGDSQAPWRRIWYDTAYHEGTHFIFEIPIKKL